MTLHHDDCAKAGASRTIVVELPKLWRPRIFATEHKAVASAGSRSRAKRRSARGDIAANECEKRVSMRN